jgi:hypothetical protein
MSEYLSEEALNKKRDIQICKQEIIEMLLGTGKTDYVKIEGSLKFVKALEKYTDVLIEKEQKEFEENNG